MARYEAHITADLTHEALVREVGEAAGWVFSRIAGCPLLGQGTYCYLTNYNKDAGLLSATMQKVSVELEGRGVTTLRRKIERIVFDTKTGVDELAFESRR